MWIRACEAEVEVSWIVKQFRETTPQFYFGFSADYQRDSFMTGLDALQSVQFVTKKGKRLAILTAEDWEALIEWLETLEDAQVARQALAELKAAKGNRRRAGWLKWSEVKGELE
jgi:hypothetical protein